MSSLKEDRILVKNGESLKFNELLSFNFEQNKSYKISSSFDYDFKDVLSSKDKSVEIRVFTPASIYNNRMPFVNKDLEISGNMNYENVFISEQTNSFNVEAYVYNNSGVDIEIYNKQLYMDSLE
jgi:hypothetical protein